MMMKRFSIVLFFFMLVAFLIDPRTVSTVFTIVAIVAGLIFALTMTRDGG